MIYRYDAKNMTEKDLEEDAIKKLYDVYVWANQEAEADPNVHKIAREIFNKMEQGNKKDLETWKLFKDVSIKEFKRIYECFNVKFDEFHCESMYSAEKSVDILNMMEKKELLQTLSDGRKVYEMSPKKRVTIIKVDGSSIYLSRDIAAAIDRQEKFNFTKMYYVVDSSQFGHFIALFSILRNLGFEWADNMVHIKFGRIQGMSTRKGTAVFLEDLVSGVQEVKLQAQQTADSKYFTRYHN